MATEAELCRECGTDPPAPRESPSLTASREPMTAGQQLWQEANPLQLVADVNSDDPHVQLPAVMQIRKVLSIERSPPIEEVIAAGVVPRFVQFLHCGDNPMLQFESAWVLTNIASGTSEHTRLVIDSGAVPLFVQLLLSPSDDLREQAVWALGNIAADSPRTRDLVLTHGALQPLLKQLNPDSKMSLQRNATWALSNLGRGKPPPNWHLVAPAIPVLAQMIFSDDDEVLADVCWALSYLTVGPNVRKEAVLDTGICARIVELMGHSQTSVQMPAVRAAGELFTGDDDQTQCVLNCGPLPRLLALLQSPRMEIRKEACWAISNITAGTSAQIQEVIEANIIPPVVHLLATAAVFQIKKEAAWSITNATNSGSLGQIKYLVEQGCIKPLCNLLTCKDCDARCFLMLLEGIQNVLRAGMQEVQQAGSQNPYATFVCQAEGFDKLKQLHSHDNEEVRTLSARVLDMLDPDSERGQQELYAAAHAIVADQGASPLEMITSLEMINSLNTGLLATTFKYDQVCGGRLTTLLHCAAWSGNTRAVASLLVRGVDVDMTVDGTTALLTAVKMGHEKTATLLLERGATVDAANEQGRTALNLAAARGNEGTVALLIDHGASVNGATKEGVTVLMTTAQHGHAAIVALLLDKGAQVDAVNQVKPFGGTALIMAAQRGHEAVVVKLIEKGASLNVANEKGQTALTVPPLSGCQPSPLLSSLKAVQDARTSKAPSSELEAAIVRALLAKAPEARVTQARAQLELIKAQERAVQEAQTKLHSAPNAELLLAEIKAAAKAGILEETQLRYHRHRLVEKIVERLGAAVESLNMTSLRQAVDFVRGDSLSKESTCIELTVNPEVTAALSKASTCLHEIETRERWKAQRVAAGVDHLMRDRPPEHICPITHEVMKDPVTDASGATAERAAMERWLAANAKTSPLFNVRLNHKKLNPNNALKSLIQDWEASEHQRCMASASAAERDASLDALQDKKLADMFSGMKLRELDAAELRALDEEYGEDDVAALTTRVQAQEARAAWREGVDFEPMRPLAAELDAAAALPPLPPLPPPSGPATTRQPVRMPARPPGDLFDENLFANGQPLLEPLDQ